ncbi:MAG: CDP-alcohol phosphatidyltransferase family protein [Ruminococcaceae bacterium]|nr:CDP-alcohol phosphatidyltransferase family protein [Oscillospiraceae bacterium]
MKNIPNILTLLRIALIPFFVWQIAVGNNLVAGLILLVSSLTDLFDGYLARKFSWVSDLGKVLDPIADKLTQSAVSVMLIVVLRKYWYFFAIIIIKDFFILLLGSKMIKQGLKFKGAKFIGKATTFVYYGGMIFIILFPNVNEWIKISILSLSVLLSIATAAAYLPEYFRYIKDPNNSCWDDSEPKTDND